MLNTETDPCPPSPSAPTRGWLSARGWRTFRPGHCGHVPARGPGLALPAPPPPSRCTQGRKRLSGAPGPCFPLPSGQAPTPGWTKRRQYSRARHPFRGRRPYPGAPGVPAARERAVRRGSAQPGLRDPGDRPGRGDPERLVLLSAPSGLAGDEEERVQAGTGAHTLACILGRARDHTAGGAQTRQAQGTGEGTCLWAHTGPAWWCQDARRPLHPPLCSGWGASSAVDTQCCWCPRVRGGTEDGQEPQNSVRVPGEQSRGSACSGVPVVTSPLSGRPQGSTRPRPTWRPCSSWGGSEL